MLKESWVGLCQSVLTSRYFFIENFFSPVYHRCLASEHDPNLHHAGTPDALQWVSELSKKVGVECTPGLAEYLSFICPNPDNLLLVLSVLRYEFLSRSFPRQSNGSIVLTLGVLSSAFPKGFPSSFSLSNMLGLPCPPSSLRAWDLLSALSHEDMVL